MGKFGFNFICNESWEDMQPTPGGRHCTGCNKAVIDLTGKTGADIAAEIKANPNGICGRLKFSQTMYSGLATTVLLTTAGTALTNTVYAQEPAKKTTDAKHNINPALKDAGDLFDGIVVGAVSEQMPAYKDGGDNGLIKFMKENWKYREDTLSGKVMVQFVVDTAGNVKDEKIVKSLSPGVDAEALRIIRLLKFTPGHQNGKPVDVTYMLPITYTPGKKEKE